MGSFQRSRKFRCVETADTGFSKDLKALVALTIAVHVRVDRLRPRISERK
jgi:hypothetical protein